MKNVLMIMSMLLCSLLVCTNVYAKNKQSEQALDQIVAIINDDVVTKSELNHAIDMVKLQMTQGHQPVPADSVLQKQVLDQLINKKLQLQLAKQANIAITDTEVDKAINHIAQQNNMSVKDLYQHINSDGMKTDDYRAEIHDQMTLQKIEQSELMNHITVTPEEVTAFMHSKEWQNNALKEYHLEDIMIPFSDTPSTEEILSSKKRAQAVLTKLNDGKTFAEVEQSDTGGDRALQGGDLGWRKLPEIPSVFAEKVAHMRANQIAGPIQAPNGFHIIRLIEVRSISTQAAPGRKQVEELLFQRKFAEAVQVWVSKLRGQAFIVTNPNQNG
ncbi:MAG: hypothetical protein EPO11_08540 [Gammaproteobacteria bacterium]|nr:MAG: hypothetical protein EPO11_08540 [Gammaproteobacteria bacterium]